MLSRFHRIPERNGQTDRRTDCYINIARDKQQNCYSESCFPASGRMLSIKTDLCSVTFWVNDFSKLGGVFLCPRVARWPTNWTISRRSSCLTAGSRDQTTFLAIVGRRGILDGLKWDGWVPTFTRNLAIANRSRVSCAHKVTTLGRLPKWPSNVTQGHRKCRGSVSSYDFLLTFHSNYGPVLYRFPHTAGYWSIIANVFNHPPP